MYCSSIFSVYGLKRGNTTFAGITARQKEAKKAHCWRTWELMVCFS